MTQAEFPAPISHVIDRVIIIDNIGFLQRLRFAPTLHHKSPNMV
jgi:hypothetical protein